MFVRSLSIFFTAAGLIAGSVGTARAQGGGLGTPNQSNEGAIMGGMAARALTPFEQFTGKLKLDDKTQVPAVREMFMAALQEAGPVGAQLLQLRQRLLNVMLTGKPEDVKPVQDAYAEAAAKMAGIEAATFAKVYATLKPNQQANAAQAFALLAGMFQPSAPSGRGGQRRGGL